MDFVQAVWQEIAGGKHKGEFEIVPNFIVRRSKDLMTRGKAFYAVWNRHKGMWSTDEYDVQTLVDELIDEESERRGGAHPRYLSSYNNNGWKQFKTFIQNLPDNAQALDSTLTFANTEVKKSDYSSKRLDYVLEPGDHSAWDELIGTLYSVEERAKIEWAIGAIVSGDSKKIQKFLVLYGPAGTGKSTVLDIIEKLFEGYTTTFEAKALGSANGTFATEVFKSNPLVAIQHDGDLSRIEDNTKLNSIVSHENMTMNEKHKASYTARVNAFLLMGTNQPVKITDAKSGIIRRLIDVHPTGVRIPPNHYNTLLSRIDFELGAIAYHCLEVYREMGKNYYSSYRPIEMMLQTDVFYNFIEANFDVFKTQDYISLTQAYNMYKEYCSDTGIERPIPAYKVREELRNYFDEFHDRYSVDGTTMRSVYVGFSANQFKIAEKDEDIFTLVIDDDVSLLDEVLEDCPAQGFYENEFGDLIPAKPWAKVKTTLKDVDTHELHFVQIPEQHIVVDFDLTDEAGEKSLERNLQAASAWPPTYAELSKSGRGVHLHYIYEGDVSELATHYSEGIEVKTLLGNASLRRKLTKCNNIPIATLKKRLPIKEKSVLSEQVMKSETGLRALIERNLRKEIHPDTTSSISFIKKILDDAYEGGMVYDVTDMRGQIVAFANNSTNQALQCLKNVQAMKFQGKDGVEVLQEPGVDTPTEVKKAESSDDRLVHFDVEVYPNLFVVCWKYDGAPDDSVVAMINPTAQEIQKLFKLKLVAFNTRRYDNHILYAASMGYTNEQLYNLSQKIINNEKGAYFASAFGISYADTYEFSSKKQGLKKFQIELGLKHQEMDIPWDEPVKEDDIPRVVEYCKNDVNSGEKVFHSRKQDFVARQILADLSGLTINDTTQKHTAKIIFGNDRNPQSSFVYTKLDKEFPGYTFDAGKSSYRGEDPSEGGYVYAEPGMYEDVAVYDVASMHPTSIINLNLFGKYTPNFKALVDARVAIKHGDYDAAKEMLDGKLAPYLSDPKDAKDLSYALKIVINIVYGMTSAKFDNPFRDIRNKDNIVAKRGALFMIDLKNACLERGMKVVHIKTDSIKIANATDEDWAFVSEFGKKYGYDFEHEETYDKFCLVNDAVYIARIGWHAEDPELVGTWEAKGAQFAHPYVYKHLFSMEDIGFDDLCETKAVSQGVIYLDDEFDRPMAMTGTDGMTHIGKTGRFVPVLGNEKAGILYRVKDGKRYAVTGTKGYLWLEAEAAREMYDLGKLDVDMSYFDNLVDNAKKTIGQFGSYEELVK